MNRLQKCGRDNLIIIAWIGPCVVLLTFMKVKLFGRALSMEMVTQNFAIWVLLAIGFAGKISLKAVLMRKEDSKIVFDERDRLINYRAALAGYFSLCIFLLAGLIVSCSILGEIQLIPLYVLPIILGGIAIMVLLVYSVAILIQYGWKNKGEKS